MRNEIHGNPSRSYSSWTSHRGWPEGWSTLFWGMILPRWIVADRHSLYISYCSRGGGGRGNEGVGMRTGCIQSPGQVRMYVLTVCRLALELRLKSGDQGTRVERYTCFADPCNTDPAPARLAYKQPSFSCKGTSFFQVHENPSHLEVS